MNIPMNIVAGIVAVLLFGVIIGVSATLLFRGASNTTDNTQAGDSSYQAGFEAARKLVQESPLGTSLQAQSDPRSLAGTVTNVGSGKLTVRIANAVDPFADPSLLNRTVVIDASTTLTLISVKAPAEGTEAENDPMYVPTFESTAMQASDIRVGDSVGVFLTEESVTRSEPTAVSVRVLPRSATTQ